MYDCMCECVTHYNPRASSQNEPVCVFAVLLYRSPATEDWDVPKPIGSQTSEPSLFIGEGVASGLTVPGRQEGKLSLTNLTNHQRSCNRSTQILGNCMRSSELWEKKGACSGMHTVILTASSHRIFILDFSCRILRDTMSSSSVVTSAHNCRPLGFFPSSGHCFGVTSPGQANPSASHGSNTCSHAGMKG